MQDREDGGETEADENACSKWSPKRGAELWIYGYSSAADANGRDLCLIVQISLVVGLCFIPTYHSPIGSLQYRLAVEAIVHARHEASRNENDDAEVIELVSPLIDLQIQVDRRKQIVRGRGTFGE